MSKKNCKASSFIKVTVRKSIFLHLLTPRLNQYANYVRNIFCMYKVTPKLIKICFMWFGKKIVKKIF